MKKKLLRSKNKTICGVCGGIAEYLDIDPTITRLAAAFMTILFLGFGILLYFIAALIIPSK